MIFRVPFWIALLASTAAAGEIRPENCVRAASYVEKTAGISMLVMQNGRVVFERYPNGGTRDGRWPIFSGTKNFWGLATLCAVRDRLIQLDDSVADTITEWKTDPRKSQIIIRQLLNQTDGIEAAPFLHRESIRDRNAVAIRLPSLAAPGARFIYGPSHFQILAELLGRRLRGRSLLSYFEQNVAGPLGLGRLDFKKDARGIPLLASGFQLSAREWARLGQLILGKGSYHGRRILPESLLREAFVGSDANPSYGLTFWLNRQAPHAQEIDMEKELDRPWDRARWIGTSFCRSAPLDMVVGLGSGYQRLFVIPSMNAIIVRQGQNSKFSDAHFLRLVLGR